MTKMTEMTDLERVARALAKATGEREGQASHVRFYQSYAGVAEYVELNWRKHLPSARAAVEALREPSVGMMNAASGVFAEIAAEYVRRERAGASASMNGALDYKEAKVFTAMIDHILKEG